MLKVVRSFFRLIHNKPILAVWNITERCNQDCLYCNLHENQNEDKYNELSIEKIRRKIRFLKKMGIEYIYLQGGEPLLRLDIKEIISTMIAHDIKPTIITNGTLLDLSFRDFIKDKNVNLTISLESLDNDVFRKITKNKNLNKKLKMIEKFGNISHKGNWSISTTVTKLNYKEVNNIEKFAKGNGFMYVIRGYVHQIGNAGKFNSNLCYKEIEDEIIELFEEFEKKYKKSNFIASLIYRKYVKFLKGEYNFSCDAGEYSLV